MAVSGLDPIARLIFTDDLTGLFNRRYFHYFLRERAGRSETGPVSLIAVDVDRFKSINDTLGHAEGDAFLKALSRTLSQVAGQNAVPIRFGGDEFVILLPGIGKEGASAVAHDLQQAALRLPFPGGAEGTGTGLSIGVSTWPEDGHTAEAALDQADRALYFSKKTGRGRVTVAGHYDPTRVLDRTIHESIASPRLIDRKEAIDLLNESFARVEEGTPGFLLVTGDAGTGKSRILREAMEMAKARNTIYVFTRCAEAYAPSPYRLLLNLIRIFARDHAQILRPGLQVLPDDAFSALCRHIPLLPDICGREPPDDTRSETRLRRRSLFVAMARTVWQIAQERPIVLLIDNLHFVDQPTLEVIHWLLVSGNCKVLVVATIPRELQATTQFGNSAAAQFLEECRDVSSFRAIALEPLTEEESRTLLLSLFPGAEVPKPFLDILVRLGRGVPLYLTSAIRYLLNRGHIRNEAGVWLFEPFDESLLPTDLGALLGRLLDSLDQEAVEFLSNAAVAGESFHLETVRGAMDKNEGYVQEILDRLLRANIVAVTDAENPSQVDFVSQKSRDVRYEALSDQVRQDLHRKIGESEEKRLGELASEDAAALAYHFERAGDVERAGKYKALASRRQNAMFKTDELQDYLRFRPALGRVRLPEGTRPPTGDALKAASAWVRTLLNSIKIVRIYPATAPAVLQAKELFGRQAEALTRAISPITFSQSEHSVLVNGRPVPKDGLEGTAEALKELLFSLYIQSLTLVKGIRPDESTRVLDMLAQKVEAKDVLSNEKFWPNQLDAAKIDHVDIIPLVFVTGEADARLQERDIDSAHLELLRGTLQSMMALFEARRLYPAGSSVVETAKTALHESLQYFFQKETEFTVGVSEGKVIAAGIPVSEARFGKAAQDLAVLFREKMFRTITFFKDLSMEDLDLVAGVVSSKDFVGEDALAQALFEAGARGVTIGERAYQLKQYGGRETEEGSADQRAVDLAEQWLAVPDETFVSDRVTRHLAEVLLNLPGLGRPDLVPALLRRYEALLRHPVLGERAAVAIDLVFHQTDDTTIRAATEVLEARLPETIGIFANPAVRARLGPLLRFWLDPALANESWDKSARLMEIARPPKGGDTGEPWVDELFKELDEEGVLNKLITGFRDARRRPMVGRCLFAFRERALPKLTDLILKTEDPLFIESAAQMMRDIDPDSWRPLAGRVNLSSPVTEVLNALRALVVIARGHPELGRVLVRLSNHSDRAVRTNLLRMTESLDAGSAAAIIHACMEEGSLVIDALSKAVLLKIPGLTHYVTRLLGTSLASNGEESLLNLCCRYLRLFPSEDALPDLEKIFRRRTRFFGLIRGFSNSLRATALKAALATPGPHVAAWMRRAVRDSSDEVRAAAQTAGMPQAGSPDPYPKP